ncbi:MAG: indole-3-glycerol phosphate synthase TrpC [Anaerolineae bacterium]|nr:indole-3-glycerol phosphate synthase TrpC [Anaerolineae bacterium]
MTFVKTGTILDKILAHKQAELAERKRAVPLAEMLRRAEAVETRPARFADALRRGDSVALIAEVKHASPSKGVLIEDFDPVLLAATYADNGASAISVLTDERFFQGHLDYLCQIAAVVDTPLLRKDFILDAYQVHEAAAAGASAILLIAASLDDAQLADLYAEAARLGLDALVEVHDEAELDRVLRIDPQIVGVNNRDLKTFDVDLATTARLAGLVPSGVVLVAESGIHSAEDVRRMGELGVHAVLVGEALVKAADIADRVRRVSAQPRPTNRG